MSDLWRFHDEFLLLAGRHVWIALAKVRKRALQKLVVRVVTPTVTAHHAHLCSL